jgi:GTP cyclohydrolase IA
MRMPRPMTAPSSVNGHRPQAEAARHERSTKQVRLDLEAVENAARALLVALGADLDSPGLTDTPRRMAAAYGELLTPESFDFASFPNEERYDELVVVHDIPFRSLCMHHLLPFHGRAHVGYLPNERIVGLSKLARVVEFFARNLQLQERLTTEIAEYLQTRLEPEGVGVVLEAEHLCMSVRGAKVSGAQTVTSALKGIVRDDQRTREEFLSLSLGRRG